MSRSIDLQVGEKAIKVYAYASALQSSDMCRIRDDFGLGEYFLELDNPDGPGLVAIRREEFKPGMDIVGDLLVLDRSELGSLKSQLDRLKQNIQNDADEWFCETAQAIYDAAFEYPDINPLRFSGG